MVCRNLSDTTVLLIPCSLLCLFHFILNKFYTDDVSLQSCMNSFFLSSIESCYKNGLSIGSEIPPAIVINFFKCIS